MSPRKPLDTLAKLTRMGALCFGLLFASMPHALAECTSEMMPCSDEVTETAYGASMSGPLSAQTISATITFKTEDRDKWGFIFVAAVINGLVYLEDRGGAWTPYAPKAPAAYLSGVLPATVTIPVATNMDLSGLVGSQIYVGYVRGSVFDTNATAFNRMLSNGTYTKVHTVTK